MKTFRDLSMFMRFIFGASWILTVTMLVVVLVLYTDNKRTKECLSDYIVEDRRTSALRIQAGVEANAAETKFFVDFNTYVKAKGAAREKALQSTLVSLDRVATEKAEQARVSAENPVPEVPKSCT
jgi:hypothetical protein